MKEYRMMIGEGGVFGLGGPITQCGVMYIGWHEGDSPITEERGRVLLSCDEATYRAYGKQIKSYSVLHIRGEKDDNTFLAEEFLAVNAAPTEAEQAFLSQAALPVTFTDPQFGEFTQNKRLDFFEGKLRHGGRNISITADEREDIETLRWICEDLDAFFERAARCAAEELLDLGNDWSFDAWEGEEADFVPMTAEDFAARISLTSISLLEEESFSLWFSDDDIFWGHAIEVEGSKAEGFTGASMQG
ncbi:DUF2262 domain-containing protein [Ruminococcaceae bacterium OttesenSCG-928-L11]|nr:DUF2262 domain-containing protein [Ruminococcaceae bacterium OttesenSCG-928-L11]